MSAYHDTLVDTDVLKAAIAAFKALVDNDVGHNGHYITIVCNSHEDAIVRMRAARMALDKLEKAI